MSVYRTIGFTGYVKSSLCSEYAGVSHIFSLRFGHENVRKVIVTLQLIPEEHLSVNGK